MTNTQTAGQKAAQTRKINYDNASPANKAWITRRRKQAAKKAWETRRKNLDIDFISC